MLFSRNKVSLGKTFQNGETIVKQHDPPGSMFIILEGRVQIWVDDGDKEPFLVAILEKDNVFGSIALYDGSPRISTARALGKVRVLSVNRKGFLQWLGEDPMFSLRIFLKMSERIRTLIAQVVSLRREVRQLRHNNRSHPPH
ncbi:MAG: cyclic nucleotide-binding domain-containing protein [Magnetococcales bacterium]|nr:cyclic nucleotide-binding domain-containing protein [Magnetococcales bacterium]